MRSLFVISASLAALCLPSGLRAAGLHLETSMSPSYSSSNTGSVAGNPSTLGGIFSGDALNSESGFSYDLRSTIGLSFWDKLVVGFTYNYGRTPSKRDAAAGNDSLDRTLKRSEYGPALGFTSGNFRVIFSYLLGGSESLTDRRALADGTVTSDFALKNYLRNGIQFVVGYSFPLSSSILIGPTLVYRSVKYKKQDFSNGLDASQNYSERAFSTDAKDATLLPMISIVFKF